MKAIQYHSNPTKKAKKAEVEWFYENRQDRVELTCKIHHRGLECKIRNQKILGVTGKFGLCVQNEAGQRLTQFH